MTTASEPQSQRSYGWPIFILVAIAGLFYVKWFPYYHRAFTAETTHSIGKSILMGRAASPPAPSLAAAFDYALAYGKAIWQAMVLGLLLGSAVQALVPPQWVARVLGRHGFGSVAAGSVLALPGMMCTCCAAPVVVGLRARQRLAGRCDGVLARQFGPQSGNAGVHGFRAGLAMERAAALSGRADGVGHRLSGEPAGDTADARAADDRLALLGQQRVESGNVFIRWLRIFVRMTVRLLPEYIVLVLLLGAARAWLFPHIGPNVTSSIGWIVVFAVAGMLFVIPTAGEVPIIQAMLALGMGVGPAGALLMTLPPVSLPSFAMLWGSFRRRALAVVGTVIVLFGVIAGLATVALGF